MVSLALRITCVLLALLLTGCQLGYITRSAYYQAEMMQQRVSLDYALKKYDLSPQQRQRLNLAKEVRQFMKQQLGLNIDDNYTHYVQLDRDYVTYAVNAAYKNQLKRYTWKFPIIGTVPYKGYFRKQQALDEQQDLKSQGLDTHVRGVSAYSTLGWFKDPLLSSMLRGKEHHFVNTLIHETVHANLYIKDQSKFNERVASFLGQMGALAFYDQKKRGDEIRKLVQAEKADELLFSNFITQQLKELRQWYKKNKEKTNILQLREQRFTEIKQKFKATALTKIKVKNYDWFLKAKFNNAFLLLLELYNSDFSSFEKFAQKHNQDFKAVFKKLKELEDVENPEQILENWVK